MQLETMSMLVVGLSAYSLTSIAQATMECDVNAPPGLTSTERCDTFIFADDLSAGTVAYWKPWHCSSGEIETTELIVEQVEHSTNAQFIVARTVTSEGNYTRFWFEIDHSRSLKGRNVRKVESQTFLYGQQYTNRSTFSLDTANPGTCQVVDSGLER